MTGKGENHGDAKPPAPAAQPAPGAARDRDPGRFAYDGLERVLHERARLSILASVASHVEGVVFNDLKSLCKLTDGNLSRQLQVLQEAALVEILKGQKNNRPQTLVKLTDEGRRRFLEYIAVLENVVADALGAAPVAKPMASTDGLSPA